MDDSEEVAEKEWLRAPLKAKDVEAEYKVSVGKPRSFKDRHEEAGPTIGGKSRGRRCR